jgi:hypothetical protein
VEKFSSLQKSGPAGNSATSFSASGLITSFCCAIAVDGKNHNPDAKITIILIRKRFIGYLFGFPALLNILPDA